MRTNFKTTAVVLVLLAAWSAGSAAASALAETGGAAAASPPAKVRRSAVATWFGPGFYGKQTACGQTLTPSVVGVANRTLPCGTLVNVTYEGHSLVVPVLDRGPYAHGVSWDLTAGAAQALGITETVRIGTAIVGRTANTPTLGLPPGSETAEASGGALAG